MNPAKKAPKVERGRPFVLLYTSIQHDRAVQSLSDAAFRVYVTGLAEAGLTLTEGVVKTSPKLVAYMASLDGGAAAAGPAVEELLEVGLLVAVDGKSAAYPSWTKYQPAWDDAAAVAERGRRDALAGHHKNGKHPTLDREGCPLCEQGVPSVASAPAGVPPVAEVPPDYDERTVPPEPTNPAPVVVPDPPKLPTSRQLVAGIAEDLDERIATAELPAREYVAALTEANDLADWAKENGIGKNPHVPLRNAVLAHALKFYLGDQASQTVINGINRAAKALGPEGHAYFIQAAHESANETFESERHAIKWMTTIATNARSKGATA